MLNICMDLNIFLLLLVKHAIADIGIQSMQGTLNKHNYRGKRAHLHYGTHGIGTALVFLICGIGPITALIAGAIDWIAHWHIDYVKTSAIKSWSVEKNTVKFWWITSIDQALHYLTYYMLIILL